MALQNNLSDLYTCNAVHENITLTDLLFPQLQACIDSCLSSFG